MAWTNKSRELAFAAKKKSGMVNQYSAGKVMSDETREKLRDEKTKQLIKEKALKSNHRRLVRSIQQYVRKGGSVIVLDSSWGVMLASRLDDLGVDWTRPSFLKWIDSKGCIRKYFPDFYLKQYDIYLDPKNPMAMEQQGEKVEWLLNNRSDVYFLKSVKEIKEITVESLLKLSLTKR